VCPKFFPGSKHRNGIECPDEVSLIKERFENFDSGRLAKVICARFERKAENSYSLIPHLPENVVNLV
jgi:hypothetical protein